MSPDFSIGLLVTDDDIDAVILEGWPADVRKPCIVVFDYAGHDVPDEYVLRIGTGAPNAGLTGREVFPVEYGPDCRYPSPAENPFGTRCTQAGREAFRAEHRPRRAPEHPRLGCAAIAWSRRRPATTTTTCTSLQMAACSTC